MSLRKKLALMLANLRKRRAYYTEVEYLESTGTQYIDTGYKMSAGKTMTFNGNIMWTQSNGNANFFYGYRSVNSAEYRGDMRAFFVYGTSAPPAGRLAIRYGVNTDNSTSTISQNQKYNISFDGTNLKVDGTTFINLSEAYMPANYQNMYLFYCNCTGYYSADVAKFSGRIYNWQMFEDGVLVRDFIPVLDWNMTPCMYDKVSGQLFYNQGTGSFVAGREIHYVDYLESTGTQYIDCGVPLTQNDTCEVVYSPISYGNFTGVFGSRDGASSKNFASGDNESSPYVTADFNNSNYATYRASTPNLPQTGSVIKVIVNKNERLIYVNDTLTASNTTICNDTFTTPSNCLLFNTYNVNSVKPHTIRVYGFKIKDKRDYLPAVDENGVGFMFDRVSHTCFLNQGTGQFAYPPVELEYIQTSSTAYIDTGIKGDLTTEIESIASVVTAGQNGVTNIAGNNKDNTKAITINVACPHAEQAVSRIRFGDTSTTIPAGTIPLDSYYKYITNKNTFTAYNSSGSSVFTYNFNASTSFETQTNLIIGRFDDTAPQYIGTVRHKSLKITKNNSLVRDLIPTFQSGSAGMWDKENGVFYSNQGTGDFSVGKIVESEYE